MRQRELAAREKVKGVQVHHVYTQVAHVRARWPFTKHLRLATARIASAYLYVGAHGKRAGEARGLPQRRRGKKKKHHNYQNLFQKWSYIIIGL